jgi:hypothetical protein
MLSMMLQKMNQCNKAGDVILLYAEQQFDITFKVLDRLKRGK